MKERPSREKTGGGLVVVDEEAVTVREIFTRYAGGHGLKKIANGLNHGGFRTKRGGFFSAAQVGTILDSPIYAGRIRYGVRDSRGKVIDFEEFDGQHEPLVNLELWEQVHALREVKRCRPNRVSDRGFPLSGLLRCPVCGYGMTMSRATRTRKDGTKAVTDWYACGRWKNQGTAACHFNGIRAEKAERAVFLRLKRVVTHPTLLRDVVKRLNAHLRDEVRPLQQRLAALMKERKRLESVRRKYERAFEDDAPGSLGLAEFRERVAEIGESLAALETEEGDLKAKLAACESAGQVPYETVRSIMEGFVGQLEAADADRQRALLQALVKEITLDQSRKVSTIRLSLHDDVTRVLGMTPPPDLTGPVTLTA